MKKGIGKASSILSKAIGGAFVLIAYVIGQIVKWRESGELLTADEAEAIIQIGFYLFLIYAPVDISIITKNIGRYVRKVETKTAEKDDSEDNAGSDQEDAESMYSDFSEEGK